MRQDILNISKNPAMKHLLHGLRTKYVNFTEMNRTGVLILDCL